MTLIFVKFAADRYPALKERIEAEQEAVWAGSPGNASEKSAKAARPPSLSPVEGRDTYGPLLVMLKAEKQAVLVRTFLTVRSSLHRLSSDVISSLFSSIIDGDSSASQRS